MTSEQKLKILAAVARRDVAAALAAVDDLCVQACPGGHGDESLDAIGVGDVARAVTAWTILVRNDSVEQSEFAERIVRICTGGAQ